jgi:hypothetical protein
MPPPDTHIEVRKEERKCFVEMKQEHIKVGAAEQLFLRDAALGGFVGICSFSCLCCYFVK